MTIGQGCSGERTHGSVQTAAIDSVVDIASEHLYMGIALHVSSAAAAVDALQHTAGTHIHGAVASDVTLITAAKHAVRIIGTLDYYSRSTFCNCLINVGRSVLLRADIHCRITGHLGLVTTTKDITCDVSSEDSLRIKNNGTIYEHSLCIIDWIAGSIDNDSICITPHDANLRGITDVNDSITMDSTQISTAIDITNGAYSIINDIYWGIIFSIICLSAIKCSITGLCERITTLLVVVANITHNRIHHFRIVCLLNVRQAGIP